jgi:hypothetical protein
VVYDVCFTPLRNSILDFLGNRQKYIIYDLTLRYEMYIRRFPIKTMANTYFNLSLRTVNDLFYLYGTSWA